MEEKEINFAEEHWLISSERSLYWPSRQTLILSDLHLGKAAHFRRHGIALPTQVNQRDLDRLEGLLQHYRPRQLIIVGDLLHAGQNQEVEGFAALTAAHEQTRFVLIRGNHDRLSDTKLITLGIDEVLNELHMGQVYFSHHPFPRDGVETSNTPAYFISGHLHPGIVMRLPTKNRLRLPCFARSRTQLILPAFSRFTGVDTRAMPGKDWKYYALYEGRII